MRCIHQNKSTVSSKHSVTALNVSPVISSLATPSPHLSLCEHLLDLESHGGDAFDLRAVK